MQDTTATNNHETEGHAMVGLTDPQDMLKNNGTLTVLSVAGKRRTFKIETVRKGSSALHGKRIISLQTGPNNETDFTGFGFVKMGMAPAHMWRADRKVVAIVDLWSRFVNAGAPKSFPPLPFPNQLIRWTDGEDHPVTRNWSEHQIIAATLADLNAGPGVGILQEVGYQVWMSTLCRRCNRTLTVSAKNGIGPECEKAEDGR